MYQTRVTAIEGQIHSKSRKSWKSRQKLKSGSFRALPRIAHSPFITKLVRSPSSLFNWRFNWNDSGVRREAKSGNLGKCPETAFRGNSAHCLSEIGNFDCFRGLIHGWLVGVDCCESMAARDRSLPVASSPTAASFKWVQPVCLSLCLPSTYFPNLCLSSAHSDKYVQLCIPSLASGEIQCTFCAPAESPCDPLQKEGLCNFLKLLHILYSVTGIDWFWYCCWYFK